MLCGMNRTQDNITSLTSLIFLFDADLSFPSFRSTICLFSRLCEGGTNWSAKKEGVREEGRTNGHVLWCSTRVLVLSVATQTHTLWSESSCGTFTICILFSSIHFLTPLLTLDHFVLSLCLPVSRSLCYTTSGWSVSPDVKCWWRLWSSCTSCTRSSYFGCFPRSDFAMGCVTSCHKRRSKSVREEAASSYSW